MCRNLSFIYYPSVEQEFWCPIEAFKVIDLNIHTIQKTNQEERKLYSDLIDEVGTEKVEEDTAKNEIRECPIIECREPHFLNKA